LWDVSFAVQAILATNFADEFAPMLKKAHNFMKNTQVPRIQDSCVNMYNQANRSCGLTLDFFNLNPFWCEGEDKQL
jgi:hypothetical protein